jgi:hypothetical protein
MTGSDGWYRMPKIVYFYIDSMAYVRFGIPSLGEWVASKIQIRIDVAEPAQDLNSWQVKSLQSSSLAFILD